MATFCGGSAIAVFAAACSSSGSHPAPTTTPRPIAVQLDNVPAGSIALAVNRSNRTVGLDVRLYGLPPGEGFVVELQAGSCLSPPASPLISFPMITADQSGTGQGTAVRGFTRSTLPVQVRLDVRLSSDTAPDAPPIGCTEFDTTKPPTEQALFPQPGHRPYGQAIVSYDPKHLALSIKVVADALDSSSRQTAEVHSGSCRAEGQVLYRLNDLVANAQRHGDVTSTIAKVLQPPPATGWYIVISANPSAGGQVRPHPILCGDLRRTS